MAWELVIGGTLTAIDLANRIAASKGAIKTNVNRIINRVTKGYAVIPVFGAGGVGKSTISDRLVADNPLDVATDYKEDLVATKVKFPGELPGRLLVALGQRQRVESQWSDLLNKVVDGTSIGLINVVSYGLHSFEQPQSIAEHDDFENGMSAEDFVLRYAEKRREVEIELMAKIAGILPAKKTGSKLWMVTVVNKQDLWWGERKAVQEHYQDGQYAALLKTFEETLGKANFQHEFLPASMAISNLASPSGEVLMPTAAGYDMNTLATYMQSMFSRIDAFIEQGRG